MALNQNIGYGVPEPKRESEVMQALNSARFVNERLEKATALLRSRAASILRVVPEAPLGRDGNDVSEQPYSAPLALEINETSVRANLIIEQLENIIGRMECP